MAPTVLRRTPHDAELLDRTGIIGASSGRGLGFANGVGAEDDEPARRGVNRSGAASMVAAVLMFVVGVGAVLGVGRPADFGGTSGQEPIVVAEPPPTEPAEEPAEDVAPPQPAEPQVTQEEPVPVPVEQEPEPEFTPVSVQEPEQEWSAPDMRAELPRSEQGRPDMREQLRELVRPVRDYYEKSRYSERSGYVDRSGSDDYSGRYAEYGDPENYDRSDDDLDRYARYSGDDDGGERWDDAHCHHGE
ncbi:hypothetical protein BAY61_01205 [Prauserella marina]|uniref:Uncharacterized protein n=1 Tax=Prauserella marina TaxID=530584 RepID=A0A222VJ25_9PSEU|nr:hypothetical protein [Prauserella marina]ASR33832.1 hypothetical protein BAY61_01205 [Prauserella marina]PWV82416.1 hypothetical protein DES30_102657 [Prauserella marina]SDC68628.1 hypothetical protein SAMN05421630_103193 [Prauserella marina]